MESRPDARYLSTHAIKTELAALLAELEPRKSWPKSVSVTELSSYAVHAIPAETDDPRARRALALARVLYDHERR